jgi:hypothetical protein
MPLGAVTFTRYSTLLESSDYVLVIFIVIVINKVSREVSLPKIFNK